MRFSPIILHNFSITKRWSRHFYLNPFFQTQQIGCMHIKHYFYKCFLHRKHFYFVDSNFGECSTVKNEHFLFWLETFIFTGYCGISCWPLASQGHERQFFMTSTSNQRLVVCFFQCTELCAGVNFCHWWSLLKIAPR